MGQLAANDVTTVGGTAFVYVWEIMMNGKGQVPAHTHM